MKPTPVDLEIDGLPGAISAYWLDGPEPALVDPGPSTTRGRLVDALAEMGVREADVRHVVLTHVHLDHAGSAGHWARSVPGLRIHVHRDGATHLADPGRLVASTRRTFGDAHDRLWGQVLPVPPDALEPWEPGRRGPFRPLRALPTPGHIDHHLAYLDEDEGTLFAGDCLGIVLDPEAPTHPPTPPPSLDVMAWEATLAEVQRVGPERAAVAHFGIHDDPEARRVALLEALQRLERRVRAAVDRRDEDAADEYEEEVRAAQAEHLARERVDRYFDTFAAATDWAGMRRYVERQPRTQEEAG